MKTKLLFAFIITSVFNTYGQNNQVENLAWSQWYQYPNNFFELTWEEPTQPHGELIGYNIYRNNELFRFQAGTTLYSLYTDLYGFVSNCDTDFLGLDNQGQPYSNGFDIHVTAVYDPGAIESTFSQTEHCYGALLTTADFNKEKASLSPNPTSGVVTIGNTNLEKIIVYDISGKIIREFAPAPQIDLSNLSKGLYIIKLFSKRGIMIDKIIID